MEILSIMAQGKNKPSFYVRTDGVGLVIVKEKAARHKAVSHRENTEKAVEAFQRLSAELDQQQAKKLFVKLIVTRGFTESQIIPAMTLEGVSESSADASK